MILLSSGLDVVSSYMALAPVALPQTQFLDVNSKEEGCSKAINTTKQQFWGFTVAKVEDFLK